MEQESRRKNLHWLWLSLAIIVIDQITKFFVVTQLPYDQPLELTSWLNFTYFHNTGAAFSFLNQAGGWQQYLFGGIAIVVSIIILIWIARTPIKDRITALGLSLILGGALGNLIDRINHGYVIDFVDFHIHDWHFAVFNVADSAISIGAFFLILSLILKK